MTIVAQVNGRVRGQVDVGREATEAEIVGAIQANERVRPYLEGKAVKKTIYVPGRLVNFVV